MRRLALGIVVIAAIAASFGLGLRRADSEADGGAKRRVMYYVDPMHPAYRSDKPGIAPDCGMRLEPVFAGNAGNTRQPAMPAKLGTGAVAIDATTRQLLGIELATVEASAAARVVRAAGRVVPEETRVYRVNCGVDGFIRETYNDSVGTLVTKDQKLASYYAPDFIAAASGFLAASERVPGSAAKEGARSIQNYTDRLRNLGMSEAQIKRVAASRQLPESIDVVAPADGFILARNISAGQHFMHDTEFYTVADLSQVWVVAEVYDQDAPLLRPGGLARIILRHEGRQLPARVSGSLPQSEAGGGTVKVRLEVDNAAAVLRPEMLVDVELPVRLRPAVTVPLDAVLDSGAGARVYVENGDGVFEPREVETGWRSGDRVEVLRGVRPGERVVAAATFLVDSESRLKTPASGRVHRQTGVEATARPAAPTDPSCGMPVDPVRAAAAGNSVEQQGVTYYFCSGQCKQAFLNHPSGAPRGRQASGDD